MKKMLEQQEFSGVTRRSRRRGGGEKAAKLARIDAGVFHKREAE